MSGVPDAANGHGPGGRVVPIKAPPGAPGPPSGDDRGRPVAGPAPRPAAQHAAVMDAAAFWRQFPVTVHWDKPGSLVGGTVLRYSAVADGPDADGIAQSHPRVVVQTPAGHVRIIDATQARLLAKLVEAKPAVGDTLTIRYLGEARKSAPGMSPTKDFEVEVTRSGGSHAG